MVTRFITLQHLVIAKSASHCYIMTIESPVPLFLAGCGVSAVAASVVFDCLCFHRFSLFVCEENGEMFVYMFIYIFIF